MIIIFIFRCRKFRRSVIPYCRSTASDKLCSACLNSILLALQDAQASYSKISTAPNSRLQSEINLSAHAAMAPDSSACTLSTLSSRFSICLVTTLCCSTVSTLIKNCGTSLLTVASTTTNYLTSLNLLRRTCLEET